MPKMIPASVSKSSSSLSWLRLDGPFNQFHNFTAREDIDTLSLRIQLSGIETPARNHSFYSALTAIQNLGGFRSGNVVAGHLPNIRQLRHTVKTATRIQRTCTAEVVATRAGGAPAPAPTIKSTHIAALAPPSGQISLPPRRQRTVSRFAAKSDIHPRRQGNFCIHKHGAKIGRMRRLPTNAAFARPPVPVARRLSSLRFFSPPPLAWGRRVGQSVPSIHSRDGGGHCHSLKKCKGGRTPSLRANPCIFFTTALWQRQGQPPLVPFCS